MRSPWEKACLLLNPHTLYIVHCTLYIVHCTLPTHIVWTQNTGVCHGDWIDNENLKIVHKVLRYFCVFWYFFRYFCGIFEVFLCFVVTKMQPVGSTKEEKAKDLILVESRTF